jgi:hypothetical protein
VEFSRCPGPATALALPCGKTPPGLDDIFQPQRALPRAKQLQDIKDPARRLRQSVRHRLIAYGAYSIRARIERLA